MALGTIITIIVIAVLCILAFKLLKGALKIAVSVILLLVLIYLVLSILGYGATAGAIVDTVKSIVT